MSDLVEKVREVIVNPTTGYSPTAKARAAILAVLEHYSDAGNVSDVMEWSCGRRTTKHNIAAAMRAELERLRGDK